MNKQYLIFYFLILFISCQSKVFSQEHQLQGIVLDKQTKKPLPFVHIIVDSKKQGFTCDIDGKFRISDISKLEFLKFSYIGYKTKVFLKETLLAKNQIEVLLEEETYNINEVTVYPGENPAHRIINKVLENRKINKPEELSGYSCTSYNKMYVTADIENARSAINNTLEKSDSIKADSTLLKFKNFLKNQHLMMMESVSERNYQKPGKVNEKIIASRVSGMKETSLPLLATDLQSFSFYEDIITLLESRYISPISDGSTNKYFFLIEDTSYTETGDTVFSISFRPKRNKNFEGLKGILNINSNKYAIQSVVAEPVEIKGIMGMQIIQNYKMIDGYWFPVELNTDLIFTELFTSRGGEKSINFIGIGKSYHTNIKINPNLDNVNFQAIELEIVENAHKQADSVWTKFRHDTLTKQERSTYQLMDSIGEKVNLDNKIKLMQNIATGYFPFYFIDINLLSIFDVNQFEGYRLGFGFRTNEKISSILSLGIYGAYGFKDMQWKYGGNIDILFSKKQEIKLSFEYRNDVFESSGYSFLKDNTTLNASDIYREYLISDMTYKDEYIANFSFRPLKKLKLNLFARQAILRNTSAYSFYYNGDFAPENSSYTSREAGFQLRYSPKESLAYLADELYNLKSYQSPVFYLNVIKGFKESSANFDYYKLEFRFDLNFMTKTFGRTELQMVGAKVFGDLPYFMLYNGHESYRPFNVDISNTFATMRMNEFLSDEFVSLYFRQDIGSLLFNKEKFKPVLIFINNIGFGRLKKPELHNGLDYKIMDKGYFETGLLINNIIKAYKIFGIGFGIYYRYGPYTYSNISDNFAYKISLTLEL